MENLMPKGMLGTPRRTVIAGVVALGLAIVLLLVYLNHYRSSVQSANANTPVLRAKVFIPAGTAAETMAKKGLFEVTAIPKDQLKDGAVTDAGAIQGQVALTDIYPGQQLVTTDFGTTATSGSLAGSPDLLGSGPASGTWRAMSVNLNETRGIIPQVQTGDHVDVYVQSGPTVKLLMANVDVLAAPNQTASGTATTSATSANYILRVPSKLVKTLAASADSLLFALRPATGAKPAGTGFVGQSDYSFPR